MTCEDGKRNMSREHFEVLRRQMTAKIAAEMRHASASIGKAAFEQRVMEAMGKVPRHEFVPLELQPYAYDNIPLPIGFDKTISQPFVVALMTDLLDIQTDDTVLEIGTGLGYQTALHAELASKVFTIEIIDELGGRRDNGSADRTTLTLSSRSAMAITVGLNMLPSIK
jgi:protein-L-isoaspartate(D-aspartate) O-methyltransferase